MRIVLTMNYSIKPVYEKRFDNFFSLIIDVIILSYSLELITILIEIGVVLIFMFISLLLIYFNLLILEC